MKLNHKQKIKLARSLMTSEEKKVGKSIWWSAGWIKRKNKLNERQLKRI